MEWSAEPVLDEDAYRYVVELVYEQSRISLGEDKHALLANRLRSRLRTLQFASYRQYCDLLRSPAGGDEVDHLVDLISTNHTKFFREPEHFNFLTRQVLPQLVRTTPATLRIWSAACSSGEEPYTLGIVLAEFLRAFPSVDWRIHATDISRRMLTRGREGIYRGDTASAVPPDLLKRYFQRGVGEREGSIRVKAELRERITFEHFNLFQPHCPVPASQHVIFCRNVMIYFDLSSRATLIQRLTRQLAPGGYLIVGHSESLFGIKHSLEPVQQGIYRLP
jgi:chemotaxis protein methyltransferase CheR